MIGRMVEILSSSIWLSDPLGGCLATRFPQVVVSCNLCVVSFGRSGMLDFYSQMMDSEGL